MEKDVGDKLQGADWKRAAASDRIDKATAGSIHAQRPSEPSEQANEGRPSTPDRQTHRQTVGRILSGSRPGMSDSASPDGVGHGVLLFHTLTLLV